MNRTETPALRLVLLVSLSLSAAAQNPAQTSEPSAPVAAGDCAAVPDGSFEGFNVRSEPILRHPFAFLPWVRRQLDDLKPELKIAKNRPYNTADERADFALLQSEFKLPAADSGILPFKFNALVATVSDCRDHALDVEYDVLTTQFFKTPTAEAQEQMFDRPEQAANVTRPKNFKLTPTAGYNASDSFFAGGRLRARLKKKTASLDSIGLDGAGSDTYQSATGALNGSFDPPSFGTIAWNLGYAYQSLPTDKASLTESRFNGRLIATTQPFGKSGVVARFGGQFEGGHLQSGYQAADLGPETISASAYSSARIYSGLTFGTKHTALRTSYGFEVGANGGLGADWRRHLGDASFDFWFPIGDHRPVQVETRFTAGAIQQATGAPVPVAKRFFGGNTQQSFLEDDDWDFRANPVIRSIPARQFNLTSAGAGGDRFYSFNLTVAPVVVRMPLLPGEVTNSDDFQSQVDQQWDFNAAFLAANYITKDPKYRDVLTKLPAVRDALTGLKAALDAASGSVTAANKSLFDACVSAVRLAGRRLDTAIKDDPTASADVQYGFVAALLEEGREKALPKVVDACQKLSPALKNQSVAEAAKKVSDAFDDLETAYGNIDRNGAIKKANDELAFSKGVFNTIIHDLNVYSISPVFIFDTARIWPQTVGGQGLRYGVGGGIRLTLVSHANLTIGYARNLNRLPQEGSGALFFSVSITELLR
jgi:hypothetical protein